MRHLIRKISALKLFATLSSVGVLALIFALCLNGPRPTCGLTKSVQVNAQLTAAPLADDASSDQTQDDDDDTQASQNTSNTYEEIHDEIIYVAPQIAKPYFSYFVPASDQILDGIPLTQLQRPPRGA